jgi:hypothetical protein
MDTLKGYALIATGFTVLVVALVLTLAQEAHAPGAAPVVVTNTPAQPVPTTAQAQQSGTWRVGISPTVDSRFHKEVVATFNADGSSTCGLVSVPSGKVFVIEYVSMSASGTNSANFIPTWITLVTAVKGELANYRLPFRANNASTGHFVGGETVRIYADPPTAILGNTLLACLDGEPGEDGAATVAISGQLIDIL